MYHPTRGGVRGGADQFSWEEVKLDKHRENYLGHSLKAPVGRWQKGKDLTWYNKERGGEQHLKGEMARIKAAEEEAMLAALGQKPVKKDSQPLTKEEMSEALKRGYNKRDGERIAGVGLSSSRALEGAEISSNSRNGVTFQRPTPTENSKPAKEELELKEKSSSKSKKKKSEKKHKKKKHKRRASVSSDSENEKHKKVKRSRHDSESD